MYLPPAFGQKYVSCCAVWIRMHHPKGCWQPRWGSAWSRGGIHSGA